MIPEPLSIYYEVLTTIAETVFVYVANKETVAALLQAPYWSFRILDPSWSGDGREERKTEGRGKEDKLGKGKNGSGFPPPSITHSLLRLTS